MPETYVVRNMCHLSGWATMMYRDHISKALLVYFDIDVESAAKSADFHIVAVSAPSSHLSQMALKYAVDFLCSRAFGIECRRERAGILTLGITTNAASWVYVYELFVEIAMVTHVADCCLAYFGMPGLISI